MGDPALLPRRQRILALVAVMALVAAFVLLFQAASEPSTESVDPAVEDETTPTSTSTSPVRGTALHAPVGATGDPATRTIVIGR